MSLAEAFSALPSLGWVSSPSPVTELPELARSLGLASLAVKRDDLLSALHGGNKARKLDVLLATPPFRDALVWASLGAIGSGHLAACTAAATALGRRLEAHTFFEPLSAQVLENLSFLASGPVSIHAYASRLDVGLRRPSLLTRSHIDGAPMIPPGGSMPAGTAGVARAGLELAAQIEEGVLEMPQAVYCALGTGGTVAGLALGLGIAGVNAEIRAVATVERLFVSHRKIKRLIAQAAHWLAAHGVAVDPHLAVKVRINWGQLGRGYGVPTAASIAAVEVCRNEGVPLEPVYTGKAFAALLADAAAGRTPKRVLFWSTVRRGPLPHADDWRDRLPTQLQLRLVQQASGGPKLGRRLVLGAAAASTAALVVTRVTGYADVGWTGEVLAPWEAQVLAAAASVLSGLTVVEGLSVAANVDRFLVPLPENMKSEIHQLIALVEHGTTPLALYGARFTRLAPEARDAFLLSLNARGGLLAQAFRGLRDLVLMGTWQDARTWAGIGYRGPWPKGLLGPESLTVPFDTFRAPRGASPRGLRS